MINLIFSMKILNVGTVPIRLSSITVWDGLLTFVLKVLPFKNANFFKFIYF